jgi:hypothetical protein
VYFPRFRRQNAEHITPPQGWFEQKLAHCEASSMKIVGAFRTSQFE